MGRLQISVVNVEHAASQKSGKQGSDKESK
jgi:hypothetical protein